MNKIVSLTIGFLAVVLSTEVSFAQDYSRHEFRLGWGDPMFEKTVFYESPTRTEYHYTGHFFLNYNYSFNRWLSAGFNVDFENVSWKEDSLKKHFSNYTLMPNIRFTYFRKGLVTMYSGLGIGMTINTGTEASYTGQKTLCSPAFGLTAYGISVGNEHFFGAFDLGALVALKNTQQIFMFGSRLLSFSIGYRL